MSLTHNYHRTSVSGEAYSSAGSSALTRPPKHASNAAVVAAASLSSHNSLNNNAPGNMYSTTDHPQQHSSSLWYGNHIPTPVAPRSSYDNKGNTPLLPPPPSQHTPQQYANHFPCLPDSTVEQQRDAIVHQQQSGEVSSPIPKSHILTTATPSSIAMTTHHHQHPSSSSPSPSSHPTLYHHYLQHEVQSIYNSSAAAAAAAADYQQGVFVGGVHHNSFSSYSHPAHLVYHNTSSTATAKHQQEQQTLTTTSTSPWPQRAPTAMYSDYHNTNPTSAGVNNNQPYPYSTQYCEEPRQPQEQHRHSHQQHCDNKGQCKSALDYNAPNAYHYLSSATTAQASSLQPYYQEYQQNILQQSEQKDAPQALIPSRTNAVAASTIVYQQQQASYAAAPSTIPCTSEHPTVISPSQHQEQINSQPFRYTNASGSPQDHNANFNIAPQNDDVEEMSPQEEQHRNEFRKLCKQKKEKKSFSTAEASSVAHKQQYQTLSHFQHSEHTSRRHSKEEDISYHDRDENSASIKIRALVSGRKAGTIIGKQGAMISTLRQESHCKITISDDPTNPDRTLSITGLWYHIAAVLSKICYLLATTNIRKGSTSNETATHQHHHSHFSFTLAVPSPLCGCLIGRKGNQIRDFRQRYNVAFSVSSAPILDSLDRPVTISGELSNVTKCLKEVCHMFSLQPSHMLELQPQNQAYPTQFSQPFYTSSSYVQHPRSHRSQQQSSHHNNHEMLSDTHTTRKLSLSCSQSSLEPASSPSYQNHHDYYNIERTQHHKTTQHSRNETRSLHNDSDQINYDDDVVNCEDDLFNDHNAISSSPVAPSSPLLSSSVQRRYHHHYDNNYQQHENSKRNRKTVETDTHMHNENHSFSYLSQHRERSSASVGAITNSSHRYERKSYDAHDDDDDNDSVADRMPKEDSGRTSTRKRHGETRDNNYDSYHKRNSNRHNNQHGKNQNKRLQKQKSSSLIITKQRRKESFFKRGRRAYYDHHHTNRSNVTESVNHHHHENRNNDEELLGSSIRECSFELLNGDIEVHLLVPNDIVGCIIGRGGKTISEIRETSGAFISITDDGSFPLTTPPNVHTFVQNGPHQKPIELTFSRGTRRDRVILIRGGAKNVRTARYLMGSSILNARGSGSTTTTPSSAINNTKPSFDSKQQYTLAGEQ